MSPYIVQCTVCSEKLEGRKCWLDHLLSESHQAKARVNCAQWSKEERECILVALFTVPLDRSRASNLLSQFGVSDLGGIVTDFVWWPERPKVALLEFECRERVDEIVNAGKTSKHRPVEVRLDDCVVHFKKAVRYFDIEWNELILCSFNMSGDINDAAVASSSGASLPSQHPLQDSSKESPKKAHRKRKMGPDSSPMESTEVSSPPPPPCTNSPTSVDHLNVSLLSQFQKLVSLIEIPSAEYATALEIIQKIENVFGPEYTVAMYRTWFLKLRSEGSDILALYIYKINDAGGIASINKIDRTLLSTPEGQTAFPNFVRQTGDARVSRNSMFYNDQEKVRFLLTCTPNCMIDVQACRLIDYLLKFDPRAKDLLSLVFLWARGNRVVFGRKLEENASIFGAGSPAPMVWMVIFFLCRNGILPPPRDIPRGDHKRILYGRSRSDIGFEEDPRFLEEWKSKISMDSTPEERNQSVLLLAKDFFSFFAQTFSQGKWIVNTRDAEIHGSKDFFNSHKSLKTKLSPAEVTIVRKRCRTERKSWRVHMVHPIQVGNRLIFNNEDLDELCDKSRRTSENLARLLGGESEDEEKWDLERALTADAADVGCFGEARLNTNYGFWKGD